MLDCVTKRYGVLRYVTKCYSRPILSDDDDNNFWADSFEMFLNLQCINAFVKFQLLSPKEC